MVNNPSANGSYSEGSGVLRPTSDSASTASHERFARSDQVDSTIAGDRAVIFHREKGAAITLNSTATVLWEFMEGPRTRQELEGALMRKWPAVGAETAARDVGAFLEEMLSHGFCRRVEGSGI